VRRARLRVLARAARPHRGLLALTVVVVLVTTAAALAPAYLAGKVVDDVIATGSTSRLEELAAALVAAVVIAWGGAALQIYLVVSVCARVLRELRLAVFDHVQRLPMTFHDRYPTGLLMARMTSNLEQLEMLVTGALNTIITGVLIIGGTIVIMFTLNAALAGVCVAIFALSVAVVVLYGRLARGPVRRGEETLGVLSADVQETLAGRRVVRTFAQGARHREQFHDLNESNKVAHQRPLTLARIIMPSIEFLGATGIALVLLFGGLLAMAGELALGVVVSFTAYMRQALAPVPDLAFLYTKWIEGTAALDRLVALLDEPVDQTERPGARPLATLDGEVRLEGVRYGYGDGPDVLHDVSVTLPAGQTVALVGATGSGKTTLGKLAIRWYAPRAGRVLLDGTDLRDLPGPWLYAHLGLVPQEPFLFRGTVRENVTFARPDATDDEVLAALERIGAREHLQRLPDGLDTQVGQRGDALSAGERQLVALGRAMLPDPKVLLLDEATASVDVATESRMQRALEAAMTGRTALVIAHRLSTVRRADRIVVLDGGRVVEEGTHDELAARGGRYAELLASRA
jgi:ABC-type multidrug transport system fused ATPase/permease subunit